MTETPASPDDETRTHATEPAEGGEGQPDETPDPREHATDPAEGADEDA